MQDKYCDALPSFVSRLNGSLRLNPLYSPREANNSINYDNPDPEAVAHYHNNTKETLGARLLTVPERKNPPDKEIVCIFVSLSLDFGDDDAALKSLLRHNRNNERKRLKSVITGEYDNALVDNITFYYLIPCGQTRP